MNTDPGRENTAVLTNIVSRTRLVLHTVVSLRKLCQGLQICKAPKPQCTFVTGPKAGSSCVDSRYAINDEPC